MRFCVEVRGREANEVDSRELLVQWEAQYVTESHNTVVKDVQNKAKL